MQSPQGRQDRRGGPLSSPPAAVRAAERHLFDVHAVSRRRPERDVADVPVPGAELSDVDGHDDATEAGAIVAGAIPDAVRELLTDLWSAGQAPDAGGGGAPGRPPRGGD